MINKINYLYKFRDGLIFKDELESNIGKDLINTKIEKPIEIRAEHLINILEKYKKSQINVQQLLDWVNIVWFTELFMYYDEHEDCIASVMNELEEIDEDIKKISSTNVQRYINALKNNRELGSEDY